MQATKWAKLIRDERISDGYMALVGGLMVAFVAVLLATIPLSTALAGKRDFVAYWAAGQQLARGANPYDPRTIEQLETGAGLFKNIVLMMRNPPWALPLAAPFGYLPINIAMFVWGLLLAACLGASIWVLRRAYGGGQRHWVAISFLPALLCLTMGQTALLTLFGFVLFLLWHRQRPWLAGAALWFCSLKPQLFLPFVVVLVLWMLVERAWRVLGGWLAAMALSCLAAQALDRTVWQDYLAMMRAERLEQQFIPCLADALRLWLRPEAAWLQSLPSAAACLWAAWWYWRRRRNWDWLRMSEPVMLAGLVTAPYCWLYDQSLAIPALMGGAARASNRWWAAGLTSISLAVGLQLVELRISSAWFLWPAPVWLLWYLAATRKSKS